MIATIKINLLGTNRPQRGTERKNKCRQMRIIQIQTKNYRHTGEIYINALNSQLNASQPASNKGMRKISKCCKRKNKTAVHAFIRKRKILACYFSTDQ